MTLVSLAPVLLLAPALSIAEPPYPVNTHSPEAVAFVDVQTATPMRLAEFGITSPHARLEARDAALAALPPDKTEIARSRPILIDLDALDSHFLNRRVEFELFDGRSCIAASKIKEKSDSDSYIWRGSCEGMSVGDFVVFHISPSTNEIYGEIVLRGELYIVKTTGRSPFHVLFKYDNTKRKPAKG